MSLIVDNVAITPGSGATIASDDVGGVQYQRVKLTQGADGVAVDVSAAAPLSVNMATSQGNAAAVSGSITAQVANTPGTAVTASTTAQVVANVAPAGNATFHLVSAAFVGTVVFEASLDGGLNYAPVMAIREDGTGNEASTALNVVAAFIRTYTVGIPGFNYFRVRCSAFTSGTLAVYLNQGPFLVETNPSLAASSANIGVVGAAPSTTGTLSSPALAVTSFTVLAANTARKMAAFYNDSANVLYLALATTASTTAYTVQIPAGGYYELPGSNTVYTGLVTGISTVASGNVRVTELT